MNDKQNFDDSDLNTAVNSAIDLMPAPIQKNAFKAFDRLCTAAINLATSFIDDKTRQIEATTNGKVALINQSSTKIAEAMQISEEYVEAASLKYAKNLIGKQKNIDDISKIAAEQLHLQQSPPIIHSEYEEISDDWLNSFEAEAYTKSSDEMKLLFGKILALEITNPNSFSIKAIKTLSELDKETAQLFMKFCSISCLTIKNEKITDGRIIIPEGKNVAQNGLKEFGISFAKAIELVEYGLISSELETNVEFLVSTPDELHEDDFCLLGGKKYTTTSNKARGVPSSGPMLSKVGRELALIVDVQPVPEYNEKLKKFFERANTTLFEI